MNKKLLVAGVLACALAMPLVGCGGGSATTASTGSASTSTSAASGKLSDADAVGQWRGSVEITGQTVYGTAGGNEQMLDVNLEDGGKCTVEPLAAHADLLKDEGTWTLDGDTITLKLSKGDIKLEVVDKATLKGTASDFDIADFDTISFDFYG